jgi:hemerythrin
MQQPTTWSSEMKLGVPAMDELHHAFFAVLEELEAASDNDFPARFDSLVDGIERDFAAEEKWMGEIKYGALQSHVEQHARVLSALHHAQSGVMAGDIAQGREAIELLSQWFVFHITTMDNALARAIQLANVQDTIKTE